MGKVASILLGPLEAWFNSDDHLPPHFHLEEPGKWQVGVRFLREASEMFDIVYGKGPTGRQKRVIVEKVTAARPALLREWEAKVHAITPGEPK